MEQREPTYDQEFDALTIFYDIFKSVDGRWVVLLGPSLGNLMIPTMAAVGTAFGVPVSAFEVRNRDRNDQIWVPSDAADVVFKSLVPGKVEIQPNHSDWFAGKRVAFTLSKDNDLHWIKDWAYFHARRHGCNAVLFYDNESSRYAKEEIYETLSSISSLDTVAVVGWPYKYGPQGRARKDWDSDYCQYGMLEHARHRFLMRAAACLNCDVDELVVTRDGSSVFDRVLKSRTGYIYYEGLWIENLRSESPESARRHVQFRFRQADPEMLLHKWAVVPERSPKHAQWRVHNVRGMRSDESFTSGVLYRHFRAINTDWKESRSASTPATQYQLDNELVEAMKVFAET